MRTSKRLSLFTCGLALLLNLVLVMSVSAWHCPDAGTFTAQSLSHVSPLAPNRGGNHAGAATLSACLALEKIGPDKVYVGELIFYDFVLTNCSEDTDLYDVTVSDPLLGGVIWGPSSLAYGQSETFAVQYQVPWDATNRLGNTALAEGYDAENAQVSQSAETATTVLVPLGHKFLDQNWDGAKQPDEPLAGNWQIQLRNVATDQQYKVWTNNSPLSGIYGKWFPPKEMPAGVYDVSEGQQPGWSQTYPNTNGGGYRIEYYENGTFDLVSQAPAADYGLSFGNAELSGTCPCFDRVVFQSNRDDNWELYGVSSNGGDALRLTNDPAVDTAPAISRASRQEDTRIAFQSNRSGNWDIYRVDADGQNLLRLTTGGVFNNTDPAWAPVCDEQRLAFVSDRNGEGEIYVMNGDGSGQQRLTNSPAADTDPDWAPTGEAIVFQSMRNGNWDLYRVDVSGANLVQLTADAADDVDPTWSTDGNWIAFRSNRSGSWQIYFMPATGGAAVRLSAGSGENMQAVWSPTGGQLAYHSNRDGNWEVYSGDIATLAETRVTNDAPKSQAPTWSCTGDSVVYQTDAGGNWELYHVETATGVLLARVTNHAATDIYPAWAPGEEDGSLLGPNIPPPTPVVTATPAPSTTAVPTTTATGTPGPTMTLAPTGTSISTPTALPPATPTAPLTATPTATGVPTATSAPTEPITVRRVCLPVLLKNPPLHCARWSPVVGDEFTDPWLAGWGASLGGGSIGVSGGVVHLWASNTSDRFPIVWRNDLFAAAGDEFLFEVRFHYSDLTAYGTTIALSPIAFDGARIPAYMQPPPGVANLLSIHHVVDTAAPANNRFEVVLFGGAVKWVGVPGDTDWHVAKLMLENGNHYSLSVDDIYVGGILSGTRPVSVYVGNPTIQRFGGQWTQIYVDYVRISRCSAWGW